MSLWDDISIDDFKDDDISLLVDIVGLAVLKKIIETFGGDSIYVPKAESVIRQGRDRRIYKEFQEKDISYKGLAAKYNLTTRHIRDIINVQKRLKWKIHEKQLELF